MTESVYTIHSGESVIERFDADGNLIEQSCIRCGEMRPARKYPRRNNTPTGRGLKCFPCKRRLRAAKRRADYLAAHPEAAA